MYVYGTHNDTNEYYAQNKLGWPGSSYTLSFP